MDLREEEEENESEKARENVFVSVEFRITSSLV